VADTAEAEDQARHELKDVVDVKINAWKGGKEQNTHALIVSLENVLWPGSNRKKFKVRYTKAIAKLHPDKVRKGVWLCYPVC
jgi:hypothetical protein